MRLVNAVVEWAIRRPLGAGMLALFLLFAALHLAGPRATVDNAVAAGMPVQVQTAPTADASEPSPAPTPTPTLLATPTPAAPAVALDVARRFGAAYLDRRLTPAQRDTALAAVATVPYRARLRTSGPAALPAGTPAYRLLAADGNGARVVVTVGAATLQLSLTPVEGPLRVDDAVPTIAD